MSKRRKSAAYRIAALEYENAHLRSQLAAEREACAVLAETWPCTCHVERNLNVEGHELDCAKVVGQAIAEAIRERSRA